MVVGVSVVAVATSWHRRRLSSRQSAMGGGERLRSRATARQYSVSPLQAASGARGCRGPPTPYQDVFICYPSTDSIRAATTSMSAAALRCFWRRARSSGITREILRAVEPKPGSGACGGLNELNRRANDPWLAHPTGSLVRQPQAPRPPCLTELLETWWQIPQVNSCATCDRSDLAVLQPIPRRSLIAQPYLQAQLEVCCPCQLV